MSATAQVHSEEEILTQEEIEATLRIARDNKRAAIALQEYSRKVHEEKKELSVSAEKYFDWITGKAKNSINGFKISEKEKQLYWLLSMYFTSDKRFEEAGYSLNKGIWLYGKYGSGKTTIMKLFSENPLLPYPVLQCNLISDEYKEGGANSINKYYRYPSMCFNDLGTEIEDGAKNHFGSKKNVMRELIENSYEMNSDKVFRIHFTTNLNSDQVENFYGPRVRSRIREQCNIFSLEGIEDKRK